MDFTSTLGPSIGSVIPHVKNPKNTTTITSLEYHENGTHLFAVSEHDAKLYKIDSYEKGSCDQPAWKCQQTGIQRLAPTHHEDCVLFTSSSSTSTSSDTTSNNNNHHCIHYYSLYDNKLLRKFRGHTGTITDISMCPADDMFLTASTDRTVRLWNVQQAGCIAQLELPSSSIHSPHVVFDSTGLVFAVVGQCSNNTNTTSSSSSASSPFQGHYIHLYDARNYTGGAFSELQVSTQDLQQAIQTHRVTLPATTNGNATSAIHNNAWNSIHFNVSGNRMMVTQPLTTTNGTTDNNDYLAIVLDGFEGSIQRIFSSVSNTTTTSSTLPSPLSFSTTNYHNTLLPPPCCFTPDDQSVLLGDSSGTIHCYTIQSGSLVRTLDGLSTKENIAGGIGASAPVSCIACNPKYAQFASSDTSYTSLWIW